MPCKACGSKSLTLDNETSSLVCSDCGTVQDFDSFQHNFFNRANGEPQGVCVRIGTSGKGSVLPYKDKKIFEANKLIDDIIYKLSLSHSADKIKNMIGKITEGELGLGDWFTVLIGACAYIVMRNESKALSIAEVSVVVGCDEYELGRMISRVVKHLDLELPEFDVVGKFERVLRNWVSFGRLERGERVERMRGQGVFLLQCMVKWFLTTGRRPLPVLVAVLVFVAEVNAVEGLKIDDVASELHVVVSTCRRRYRELLNMLVMVAQKALPWGDDVTVKNVAKYAPFLFRYLEAKSMGKKQDGDGDGKGSESDGLDLEDMVRECFASEIHDDSEANNSYLECRSMVDANQRNISGRNEMGALNLDKLRLSHECLLMMYDKFMKEGGFAKHEGEIVKPNGRKRRRQFELHVADWWSGKSELSKKLLLQRILEKDVGLDVMPPSFINGVKEKERRRTKINAAKKRINKIMCPQNFDSTDGGEICLLEGVHEQKMGRKEKDKGLDSEDFIIETLLLHRVKEEEIEKGHYNALLSLHVFNSETISEDPDSDL